MPKEKNMKCKSCDSLWDSMVIVLIIVSITAGVCYWLATMPS